MSVKTKSKTTTNSQDVKDPNVMAKIITRGALKLGFGLPKGRFSISIMAHQVALAEGKRQKRTHISSTMCVTASKPVRPNVLCRRPRMKATPVGQPVSLIQRVKTNSAGW